ncbi:MAG: hypothetical protein K6G30_12600 [Acetatifactor sp.]|nr:hypothetical protein [Acetatifactor sp.]
MKLPIFASVIIFVVTLTHAIRHNRRQKESLEKGFWARESMANSVRRKPIDRLDYINIPVEQLPMSLLADDPQIAECIEIIKNLSAKRILNLTGFTNTDLKLEYGAANITELSEYDQNYTLLVRTLQKWADALFEVEEKEAAVSLLEFAVSTHTDVSKTYDRLADYYLANGASDKIDHLIEVASTLRSSNKNVILRHLKEKKGR